MLGLSHASSTVLLGLVSLVATVLYFSLFEILFAATPGKLLSSLRVIDVSGERPRWTAILLRNIIRPVDAFPSYVFPLYLVGGVAIFLTQTRQRLGDRVARTQVAGVWSVGWADRSRAAVRQRAGILIVALLVASLAGGVITYLVPPSISPALKEKFYPDDVAVIRAAIPGAQRLLSLSVGSAQRSGGDAIYPLRFTLRASGSSAPAACTGTVTFHWTGPLDGWTLSRVVTRCLGKTTSSS